MSCSGAATTAASPGRAPSTWCPSSAVSLAAGYGGPLSLEIFNDIFRQADPFRTAVDGRRSLLWLEERVGDRLRRQDAPARPRRRDPAAGRCRAAATCSGFAFTEFNAPPDAARGLGGC